jgi:4'-phosphopantetheinyl transferase
MMHADTDAVVDIVHTVIPPRARDVDFSILSAAEQTRALRMRHEGARSSTVTARALLRRELGHVLDVAPCDVPLTTASGVPRLDGNPLHVSIAHAGGVAMVGWTRHGRLGLDVEPLDRDVDRVRLAPRVFAVSELSDPDATAPRPFLERWTRKESWLKAVGIGIGVPLRDLVVTCGPHPRVVAIPAEIADAGPVERWQIGTFDVAGTHVAAWCLDVGTPQRGVQVRIRRAAG